MNGVSTLDLVKIQRHILGLEELNSPYKLIAADVNADNEIKASDLTELRKLILGIITDLPTNESWRFVESGQAMEMDMLILRFTFTPFFAKGVFSYTGTIFYTVDEFLFFKSFECSVQRGSVGSFKPGFQVLKT